MPRTIAKNLKLQVGDGQSPEAFLPVLWIQDLPGFKFALWKIVEVTRLEQPTPWPDFAKAIRETIDLPVTVLAEDNAALTRLKALDALTNANFRYYPAYQGGFAFAAQVIQLGPTTPVGELTRAEILLRLTGQIQENLSPFIESVEFIDAFGGQYVTGNVMRLRVTFSHHVDWDYDVGTAPQLTLDIDGAGAVATYVGAKQWHYRGDFEYTIQGGDQAEAGTFDVASPLVANAASLEDRAANSPTLTFTPPVTTAFAINPA